MLSSAIRCRLLAARTVTSFKVIRLANSLPVDVNHSFPPNRADFVTPNREPPRPDASLRTTNTTVRERRARLFEEESKRQFSLIPRLEKIEVKYTGVPEDATLILNKGISTSFNVAQHLSDMLIKRSALALVNGHLWDLHRPLEENCTVELLHFHDNDPFHANRAFWRSCSFMLGAVLETVFKEDVFVELHSFPAPNVASGSFVHDVDLKLDHWEPSKEELMVLSAAMHRLAEKELPFERLEVDEAVAMDIFKDNKYKVKQIPNIAAQSRTGKTVTLYKVGDHVDISRGPMVANTNFLGRRCTIAAAHPITQGDQKLFRLQGVALPKDMFLNHFAFGILERRASILNTAGLQPSSSKQSERTGPVR